MCFHKITEGRWWRYRYNYNDNYIEAGASVRTENIGKDRQHANTKYTYTADFSKTGYIKIVVSGGAYTAATVERNIGSTMSIDRNLYIFANNNAGTANEFHSATIYATSGRASGTTVRPCGTPCRGRFSSQEAERT